LTLFNEALRPNVAVGAGIVGAAGLFTLWRAQVRARADRIADPSDVAALHDFRVAVRRLRSTLQAWREPLGEAVRDKDLRRLRRVARATGDARDAEVLLAWIGRIARSLPAPQRAGAAWLQGRLAPLVRTPHLSVGLDRFRAGAGTLARRLETKAVPRSSRTFAAALAPRVREQALAVKACLGRTGEDADLHRARIEGKRLRYLLEPLRGTPGADSGRSVNALKRLQDLLGDLNDARLAVPVLRRARREAETGGTRHAGLVPGLAALERRARERVDLLLARVRTEVLPTRGATTLAPSLRLAAALESRGALRVDRAPRP
jgi:CHAD domain-containing protein